MQNGSNNRVNFVGTSLTGCVVTVHAQISNLYSHRLNQKYLFPGPEMMVGSIVFGAICCSTSRLLDYDSGLSWGYFMAAYSIYLVVLPLYMSGVWWILATHPLLFVHFAPEVRGPAGSPLGVWTGGATEERLCLVFDKWMDDVDDWLNNCTRCPVAHRPDCQLCKTEWIRLLDELCLGEFSLDNPVEDQIMELAQLILEPGTRPWACGCNSNNTEGDEWESPALAALMLQAEVVKQYRRDTLDFMLTFGFLLEKYLPRGCYFEVLVLGHMWLSGLIVGILQSHSDVQIGLLAVADLAFLVAVAYIQPFNRTAEYFFELGALVCQLGATLLMCAFVWRHSDIPEIPLICNSLLLAKIGCKMGMLMLRAAWAVLYMLQQRRELLDQCLPQEPDTTPLSYQLPPDSACFAIQQTAKLKLQELLPTQEKLQSMPPFAELENMSPEELRAVSGFTVIGRLGSVKWLEPVNLTGAPIEKMVHRGVVITHGGIHICLKSLIHRRCEVTLKGIFEATSTIAISQVGTGLGLNSASAFGDGLHHQVERQGHVFIEFDQNYGTLRFRMGSNHLSDILDQEFRHALQQRADVTADSVFAPKSTYAVFCLDKLAPSLVPQSMQLSKTRKAGSRRVHGLHRSSRGAQRYMPGSYTSALAGHSGGVDVVNNVAARAITALSRS